jgi:DNA-binding LacI/PurR family transcriptional regulator
MGFGAILAAKDLGLRVPDDVSIIGFDNHDNSEFFGLTTVDQKTREQGVQAAKVLLDALAHSTGDQAINVDAAIEWPTELKIRSSTSRPRN